MFFSFIVQNALIGNLSGGECLSQRRCKYMEGDCLEVTEPITWQCLVCIYSGMAENIKALTKLIPQNERGAILLLILVRLVARVKGLHAFIEQNYPEEVKELITKMQHASGGEQVGSSS